MTRRVGPMRGAVRVGGRGRPHRLADAQLRSARAPGHGARRRGGASSRWCVCSSQRGVARRRREWLGRSSAAAAEPLTNGNGSDSPVYEVPEISSDVEAWELETSQDLLLPKTNSSRDTLAWLFRLLLQGHTHTWRLFPAFVLTFAGKFAGIYSAVLFKKAVDSVLVEGQVATGLKVALAFLVGSGVLKMVKSASGEGRHVIFAPLSQQLSWFLALKIFAHLFSLDSSFHVKRQTGGVINIVERGIRAILTFFRTSVLTLIPTLVEWSLVCTYVASKFSFNLAGVLVATFAAYLAWTVHWTQLGAKQRLEANKKDIQVNAKLADTLLNYETVVLTGNEGAELRQYNRLLREYQHFSLKNVYCSATMNAGQGAIIAAGITASLVLTVMGCFSGAMTVGDIVLVQALLLQLLEPLQFLGWYYSSLKNCFVDLEALLEILLQKSNLKDGTALLASGAHAEGLSVELRGARYGYQEDREILRGVDLRVGAGETVAVVGSSGSGKSTLLRMILRLYDLDEGVVLLDGHHAKDLKLSSLRGTTALIPQDCVLFNDTIFNNVRYGNLSAPKGAVLEALRSAQLDDLIASLPEGHGTLVGERGIKLSGGERQRIAIARAILRRPRLLVCDEATSSLDSETESEIMKTLRSVASAKGVTCILISHRLSTVQHCDTINVLSEGRITESGTHEDLVQRGGMYAAMWDVQEKKEMEGEAPWVAGIPVEPRH